MSRLLLLALLVTELGVPRQAAFAAAEPGSREAEAVAKAERHFRRGVELYQEGNAEAALVEFRRAYQLAPRFAILFNMAQVAYHLNDYAMAVALYEKYLAAGAERIPEARRTEVRDQIARLRPRVGKLRLQVDAQDAQVAVDDVVVGVTPLPELTLNIGRRRLTVSTPDGRTATRIVEIPAGETVTAQMLLPSPPADPVAPAVARTAPGASGGVSAGATAAWLLAGAFAVGSGVTGGLALEGSRDLSDLRQSYPLTSDEALRDKAAEVKDLRLAADLLLAGAVLSGTIALILTVTSSPSAKPELAARKVRASALPVFGPGHVGLRGRF